MTDEPRSFAGRVGALLGLIGLVFGIPAVLIASHLTPPFNEIEHLGSHPSGIAHYLTRSMGDSTMVKGLAGTAWMAWLWLCLCVVVEATATIRGRPTFHLPASRHVQSAAAALVGASLAILPFGREGLPIRVLAMPAAVHQLVGEHLRSVGIDGLNVAQRHSQTDGPEAEENTVLLTDSDDLLPAESYVVMAGDTLWSIAERELGSPLKWPVIAQLNYGRLQPDGEQLTDAHWIFPGWVLSLPARSGQINAESVVVQSNTQRVALSPLTSTSNREPSISDDLIGGDAGMGDDDPMSTKETKPPSMTESQGSQHDGRTPAPIPAGLVGYGVLGAGVVALLECLRRVQRRHRPTGLRIALPEDDIAALERRLRIEADPEGVEIIDLGLKALVVLSLRMGMMPPHAPVVRLGDQVLEVVLDSTGTTHLPPKPFTADEEGRRWFLSRDYATVRMLKEDKEIVWSDAPLPALVTMGRDLFGLVLVDLEQAGSIDITGENAEGILGIVAVEMATAKWSEQVDLILVGFDQELEALERVSHVPTVAQIVTRVQRQVRERRALLASVGRLANWEIRWTEGGDSWDLCVVVCGSGAIEADPEGVEALVGLAGEGGLGLTVVLGSPTGTARWHLDAGDGRIEITANGTRASVLRSPSLDVQMVAGVASLVRTAGRLEGVALTDPPHACPSAGESADGLRADDKVDRQEKAHHAPAMGEPGRHDPLDDIAEVEVRVLGPVEIAGAARPFTRAWAIELVVYLAMHPNGATSEQWATALWPDRIMAPASLHSTASAARRSLGVSVTGEDHLPRAHGRLSLNQSVRSDWSRFVELGARAEPDSWRDALELIRGRPFEGLRAPDWVLLEGISANVEAIVVDLAGRYAEYCLSADDPGGAEWSARQGLRVSAYDERLYRVLLRAADAAGNPAGVESVMTELVHLVAEDVEPYDAIHPETMDLYRLLSRRPSQFAKY